MWDVLAIAPTDDAKVIRRAYAARLREIDPDRDREAFARLRAALESALAGARGAARQAAPRDEAPVEARADEPPEAVETVYLDWTSEPETETGTPRLPAGDGVPVDAPAQVEPIEDEPIEEEPIEEEPQAVQEVYVRWTLPQPTARDPDPETAGERARERVLLIALESALQRGDAREAAQLYFRAAATGAVPLGDTERMLVRLFTVALEDASFDGAAFRSLAKALAWDQPRLEGTAVSDVRQRVLARLAAEDWYDTLIVAAEGRMFQVPRFRAKVARLILRRISGVGLLRINRSVLRELLDQLKPHEVWLRDRIPPEWIAVLENRMRRRELIALGISVLFIGGLLLNSLAVITVTWIRDGFSEGIVLLGMLDGLLAWLLKVLVVNYVQRWRRRIA